MHGNHDRMSHQEIKLLFYRLKCNKIKRLTGIRGA